MISRPSNSGMATCIAASIGVSAASEAAQAARDVVRHSACTTGTSSVGQRARPTRRLVRPPLRAAPPRGQHGDDQRVAAAQQRGQPVVEVPQRRYEDRQRIRPGVGQRRAQRVDETGVAGQRVRPVEDHPDRSGGRRPLAGAPWRRRTARSARAARSPHRSAAPCRTGTGAARAGCPGRRRPGSAARRGPPRPAPWTARSAPRPARPRRRARPPADRRRAPRPARPARSAGRRAGVRRPRRRRRAARAARRRPAGRGWPPASRAPLARAASRSVSAVEISKSSAGMAAPYASGVTPGGQPAPDSRQFIWTSACRAWSACSESTTTAYWLASSDPQRGEVAAATGHRVRDRAEHRAPAAPISTPASTAPQPAGHGEDAEQQPDEQAEPGAAGRAGHRRAADRHPAQHLLHQAQVGAHDRGLLHREAVVGQVVHGPLGVGVVVVRGHGDRAAEAVGERRAACRVGPHAHPRRDLPAGQRPPVRAGVVMTVLPFSTRSGHPRSCGSTLAPNASMNASSSWPTWCRLIWSKPSSA